jgi:hypothetical protein
MALDADLSIPYQLCAMASTATGTSVNKKRDWTFNITASFDFATRHAEAVDRVALPLLVVAARAGRH